MSDLPEFHPSTVLRDWSSQSPGQAFTLADALTGVAVFGATGSGKTSGPLKHLAQTYLAHDFGGLVLTAKKEDRQQWQKWAAATGRLADLVIVDASCRWRFNPLDWEAERPGEGGGFTLNIAALLRELAGGIGRGAGKAEDSGGDNRFWDDSLHQMNMHLVDLPLFAGLPVALPLLQAIVDTAPRSLEQAEDAHWKETSACWAILREADEKTRDADPEVRADFEGCRTYWTQLFAGLSERTRSIVTLSFSMLAQPFITRPLRRLFCTDTNITPEAAFDGKIILLDFPVQEFHETGRIAQLAWKFCMQRAILQRERPADGTYLRPVFIAGDEAANWIRGAYDALYQSVCRSAGGCTLYAVQNRESLVRELGSAAAVDSLLGNLQCKFFCQNSGETTEWAAQLLGQHWVRATTTSVNRGENRTGGGVSQSERRQYFVEPSTFTVLRRGGPKNNYLVDAIVFNGGSEFPTPDGQRTLPYCILTFDQNK